MPRPFPNGQFWAGFPDKKDFPVGGVGTIGEQKQGCELLIDAAEPVKIGIRSIGMIGVAVGRNLVRGHKNRHGTASKGGRVAGAVRDKNRRIEGLIAHIGVVLGEWTKVSGAF
jgi:hypothetical protein